MGPGFVSGGDEYVLKLSIEMVVQLCGYIKNY